MKRIISERFVTYAAKRLPFLLTLLMSLVVTTISAHDIEVVNDDGITLYYKWMNNNTELAVSYRGDTPNQYINYKQEFSGDIVIPESVTYNGKTYSVTSIGEGAFYFCGYMTSVTIPNSVKSIGELAFERCNGLTSLTIGNSVKTIGKYVFSSCSSLSSVSIPDNVTFIDEYAFSNCSGLQSITIGSGIETIEKNVFSYCGKMADVYCYAENVPSTNSNAFIGSPIESATLHIHRASLTSYSDTEPWKNFKNKVAVEDPVLTCETPTITVDGNSIKFECNTTDVIFHYTLSSFDAKSGTTSSGIEVNNNYTITVYASKEGYIDSEVARANCQIIGGKFGDLTGDGFVDVADHVKLSEIIMNQEQ